MANREWLEEFGLAVPGESVSVPCIESIRSSRRVGPDGQIEFDLIGEVTQRRTVDTPEGSFDFYGGSTIISDRKERSVTSSAKRSHRRNAWPSSTPI